MQYCFLQILQSALYVTGLVQMYMHGKTAAGTTISQGHLVAYAILWVVDRV